MFFERTNKNIKKEAFHMNIITQDLRFRQSVVKYYFRNGATATAAQYKVSRKTVYRWVNKYDGTIKSLANESKRPHLNKICLYFYYYH